MEPVRICVKELGITAAMFILLILLFVVLYKAVNSSKKDTQTTAKDSQEDNELFLPSASTMINEGVRANVKTLEYFMTWILCSVITKPTIRRNKHLSPLSDIATRSDEAFALLLLKNSEARWDDMVSKSSKKSDVPWIYTKQAKTEVSPEGNTAKYSGWSSDGIAE